MTRRGMRKVPNEIYSSDLQEEIQAQVYSMFPEIIKCAEVLYTGTETNDSVVSLMVHDMSSCALILHAA
jgi:hypothetical protein